jgi:hypothetical protein
VCQHPATDRSCPHSPAHPWVCGCGRAHACVRAQIELLNTYQFLTAKPMVYLANLSAADYIRKKNKVLAHHRAATRTYAVTRV